jgi:preprotein translocase subunit SecA
VSVGVLVPGVVRGALPERPEERLSKLDDLGERLERSARRWVTRWRRPWRRIPSLVEEHARGLCDLSDDELRGSTSELRALLQRDGFTDEAVARSFAVVREAATRTLGKRHFDVQLAGGWVLLHGMVAEMETGEGKTLVATLPACTAALMGVPVHIVTVNDYLASRDAGLMRPLYEFLGLSVGSVVSQMPAPEKQAAYRCDVTYCTNSQLVFDYLLDRITLGDRDDRRRLQIERLGGRPDRRRQLLQRGLHFAIVDEADSVLVDEARTPLIISEPGVDELEQEIYGTAVDLARTLESGLDFEVDLRERRVDLTPGGQRRLADLGESRGGIWAGSQRRESLVDQALTALHCYRLDEHYLIEDDKIAIIDEFTGRVMSDRSWEHGLHQMIEVKEGVELTGRQRPRARISYQRFFRRYLKLGGMTGTAREVRGELASVYRLPVVRIPTHRPVRRAWLGERVLPTEEAKWDAVAARALELFEEGRAVLIGTRSVEASETLGRRLDETIVPYRVLNARQNAEEAEVVAAAGHPRRITVATNMAGRGTDILLAHEVRDLGGLHVIATERHEARRIDRQLFGRCGRQGDPGSYESIVSLEDDLFETHAGGLWKRIARRAVGRGDPVSGLAVRIALDWSQRSVERRHSMVRRQLVKQDRERDALLGFAGRPY